MKQPVFRTRPEAAIQKRIIAFLRARGWTVKPTHGNAFSKGWPDLWCWHQGMQIFRWVDCKNPADFEYTKAQIQTWPLWEADGIGVWIMFEADEENYSKLWEPHNFRHYWKPRYDKHLRNPLDIIAELLDDDPEYGIIEV
jgi:hypothetical protein